MLVSYYVAVIGFSSNHWRLNRQECLQNLQDILETGRTTLHGGKNFHAKLLATSPEDLNRSGLHI
jgi:hypothetical protein